MSMPFYVAPEQQMKDRADYARKGIARGRSVVVLHYCRRNLVCCREPFSGAPQGQRDLRPHRLRGVGRYNEFENLRQAGIRYADVRGYTYDRTDVTGRGLANTYAQVLGTIFSSGGDKPYEVEIVVAELGATPAQDQIYRLTYDGSVGDEANFAVMGGSADVIAEVVSQGFTAGLSSPMQRSSRLRALGSDGGTNAAPRSLGWRRWRWRCLTGPGQCHASSGGSRVIGSRPCWLMDLNPPTARDRDEPAEQPRISRVVIIGAGLIGASIGCALSAAGYAVHLRDHKISHARVAAGLGAGTIDPPISADVDLVVVAVPPGAIADLVVHSLQIYPNATVTDVGSVKAGVLDALWQRDVDLARYVGSHPMAGSHRSGPMTAHPELFVDRTWVVHHTGGQRPNPWHGCGPPSEPAKPVR
jgi:proteasome alpha subunit